MQTLLKKREKLEKQNNVLINIFFINIIIITILVINNIDVTGIKFFMLELFPSMNIETLFCLLFSIIIGEIIITKKIDYNDWLIKRINLELKRKKVEKTNNSINYCINDNLDKKYLVDENSINNKKDIPKVKVKKKLK